MPRTQPSRVLHKQDQQPALPSIRARKPVVLGRKPQHRILKSVDSSARENNCSAKPHPVQKTTNSFDATQDALAIWYGLGLQTFVNAASIQSMIFRDLLPLAQTAFLFPYQLAFTQKYPDPPRGSVSV